MPDEVWIHSDSRHDRTPLVVRSAAQGVQLHFLMGSEFLVLLRPWSILRLVGWLLFYGFAPYPINRWRR